MTEYSHSRINTYDNCPRQYQYRYVDRIKPPFELKTIETFMGNRIHHVLKEFYQQLIYQRIPEKQELLDHFFKDWHENWSDDISIMKTPLDPNHYFETGLKALREYYEHQHPFPQTNSIGLEKTYRFKVGNYAFQGIIDRLNLLDDGIYEIHDYKTTGSLPTYPDAQKDLQLALYQLSIRYHYPDAKKIRLIWHYLLFNKSWIIELDDEQLHSKEAEIIQKVFTIESDFRFEPRPSPLCSWCNYQELCPITTHSRNLKELSIPENDDGYQLVEAYGKVCASYKEKKAHLDLAKKEKEELEQRLLNYAKTNQFKVIQGNKMALQLQEKVNYKFPDSKDPARSYLENLLEEHQLWKEASMIHSVRLNKLVNQAFLSEDLRREILALSSLEVKTSFKWIKSSADIDENEVEDESIE